VRICWQPPWTASIFPPSSPSYPFWSAALLTGIMCNPSRPGGGLLSFIDGTDSHASALTTLPNECPVSRNMALSSYLGLRFAPSWTWAPMKGQVACSRFRRKVRAQAKMHSCLHLCIMLRSTRSAMISISDPSQAV